MNQADTDRMGALLSDAGIAKASTAEDAELVLINGCSIRDKAVHKAVSALGRLQPSQRSEQSKTKLIGLGGCVGQMDKGKIFSRAPYLDFVFGPDAIEHLPEIVHRVSHGERRGVFTEFDRSQQYSTETRVEAGKAQAFVNIMKGCDKYCTYCIVPFTRGREKSRTIDDVLLDLVRLVAGGVKEVTLLGQNVNSFGKGNLNKALREPQTLHNVIGPVGPKAGEENFPQLLRAIEADPRLQNLKRLRFTSSHPLDFSDELIECYADQGGVTRLAPHLHLPVQSGSNTVLARMGRHHKIEQYIEQMERLKAVRPDVALSTDLIVGFPGETEAEFEETLGLLDRLQYDSLYAFAYSPRPGTRAAKLADDVPDAEKNRRLNQLLQHQYNISRGRYARYVGQAFDVLVEGPAHAQKGKLPVWTGRTGCNRVVNFESPRDAKQLVGKLIPIKITSHTHLALYGEIAEATPGALQ